MLGIFIYGAIFGVAFVGLGLTHSFKDFAETLYNITATGAVLVGGAWAYVRYVRQSDGSGRLDVSQPHTLDTHQLSV